MERKNITILIKPSSSMCNLRCKYCFYLDTASKREIASFGFMNEKTAQTLIVKSLEAAKGGVVHYAFQGGEPLMSPLSFFEHFVEFVKKNNKYHSQISYAVQTNGTLITEEHCKFFKKNNILIGISLDGKSHEHNANRVDINGKGTFNRVIHAIDLLKKYKCDFNVLAVVTKYSPKTARIYYQFLKNHDIHHMQFITCFEPIGVEPLSSEFALTNDGFYKFYKNILDLYVEDMKNNVDVHIRHFDNMFGMLQGYEPELCGLTGTCLGQLVVEGNGNCYPCDFYCEDQYLMGNINEDSLEDMAKSDAMKRFVTTSYKVDKKCLDCDVYSLCRGGCRRERDYYSDGDLRLNMYCEGRKKFFRYMKEKLGYNK